MPDITRTTRILASCCSACPFCIMKRRWPESTFASVMNRIETCCPFCRAYARLKAAKQPRLEGGEEKPAQDSS